MIRLLISEPSLVLKAKLNEYSSEVIEERDDFNYCVFDFEESSFEEIIDCLQTPSFSTLRKVVICKNPYFIKGEKIKLPFDNDIKDLEKYIENPNPDSEFIIVCPKRYYSNKSKIINLINKHGQVENLLFEKEEELKQYGRTLISKTGVKISEKAANILFERCIEDVCKLEREIAKLSLYEEYIDEDIITKMVSRPLEDDVFELTNALMAKNHKRTMQIYNDLKLLKIEPIQLIALLSNQFRLMMQAIILKKEDKTENEIATILEVHPYRVKTALRNVYNYSLDEVFITNNITSVICINKNRKICIIKKRCCLWDCTIK